MSSSSDDSIGRFFGELDDLADRPTEWESIPVGTLKLLLFDRCLGFGRTGDSESLAELTELYDAAARRLPARERRGLLSRVTDLVAEGDLSVEALLPFIFGDPSRSIVSAATLNLAQLMPLRSEDPMTGPRYVLRIVQERPQEDERSAAMLAGLVLLGDRRTQPVLRGYWRQLGPAGRSVLARAWTGLVSACHVEFLLDWLEDADNDADLGSIATNLARMPRAASLSHVMEIHRSFPVNSSLDAPPISVIDEWSFSEFGKKIEPRLRALRGQVLDPGPISDVMRAWGLRP